MPTEHTPSEPERAGSITRREAIRRISLLLGGAALVGCSRMGDVDAAAEKAASAPAATAIGGFSVQDIAFLDEIAETIVPATKTPGAKDAKVGAFMALMVTDCYDPAEQKVFRSGMRQVDDAAKATGNVAFVQATPQQRLAVLTTFDHEAHRAAYEAEAEARTRSGSTQPPPYDSIEAEQASSRESGEATHFFRMMKELTLLGYFTSEIGCTQVLRYTEVPGRYDPCVPYVAGTPAWAAHA